jgi:hypothetical protein
MTDHLVGTALQKEIRQTSFHPLRIPHPRLYPVQIAWEANLPCYVLRRQEAGGKSVLAWRKVKEP